MKTLLDCFLHWEKTQPNRVYMTQPWLDGRVSEYTWAQVGDQVRRMAAYLVSLNLAPRSSIAIVGRNSAHWVMADMAIWMAGHVSVPIYATINAEGARYVIEHSEAKLLFLGKLDGVNDGWNDFRRGIPDSLPQIALPMAPRDDLPTWDALVAQHSPLVDFQDRDPRDLVTIVYTSGTTGNPKGVMHCFESMLAFPRAAEALCKEVGLPNYGPQDRILSYLPMAHVAERAGVISTSLYFGLQVFFANSLATFQQDLKRARPTVFGAVPRIWTKFYGAINDKLPPKKQKLLFSLPFLGKAIKKKIITEMGLDQVRLAYSGAAALAPEIIQWYRNLGLELLELYGMSENFAVSHGTRPGAVRVGYVGAPAHGVSQRIADSGEVLVKSPGQMLGYYKLPEKTAEEMTSDGYFKTGDRGEVDEQGRLRITGRVKELFKTTKGKYVAPVPVENKLSNHPKVECVCVTGPSQPQPFALLMLSLDAQNALARDAAMRETLTREFTALLDHANGELEDHEQLDYLVVVKDQWTVENGFLTPSLKIKRNIVEDRYLKRADGWLQTRQKVIWE